MICAAMLEGNGLDAIFIVWWDHAQVAVNLPSVPSTDTGSAWYIEYNSKKYYLCECTGDYSWDVGDLPSKYQEKTPDAIYEV